MAGACIKAAMGALAGGSGIWVKLLLVAQATSSCRGHPWKECCWEAQAGVQVAAA